jgi:hypothetical protein
MNKIQKYKVHALLVCGFAFVIGNVTWPLFNEYRVFYVPLSLFLFFILWQVDSPAKITKLQRYCIKYFVALSLSNIVKQIWYNPTIDQINDYIVGTVATLILLIFVITWAIRNTQKNGGRE